MRGITVTLWTRTQTGTDDFGAPVWTETPVTVPDVLVAPVTGEELTEALNLYGKRAVYRLGIPKGDAHRWENRRVTFFGEDFRVIGAETQGIDALIPLRWNKKVLVESYVSD